jgi:hypothetical protein
VRQLVSKKYSVLVVLFLSVLTTSVATNGGWIDSGFPYMNMADSAIVYQKGHIVINPFSPGAGSSQNNVANVRSSRLMVVLLPVFLSRVLGIPMSALTFFPLTGVLIPLIGYLIVKLLVSELWGVVFGAYLALEAQGLLRNYNMNIQGYGQLFFLLTIFLVSKSYLQKTRRRYFILSIIFFAMAVLSYYSSEFYSLVFIASLAILLKIKRMDSSKLHFVANTALAFGIIVIAFEPIVWLYSQKLLVGKTRSMLSVLISFINDVLSVLGLKAGEEHATSVISTPTHLLIINIVLLIMILFPILLFISRIIKGKKYQGALVVCLILTGLVDLVAYSGLEGHMDLKFIYLVFPICSIISVSHISTWRRSRRLQALTILFAICLLSLMTLRFALYASGPYSSAYKYRPNIFSQFDTIANQSGLQRVYLTDNIAAGKLLLSFAQTEFYNVVAIYQYPSLNAVRFLYSGNMSDIIYLKRAMNRMPDYLLVSSYSLKTDFPAQGWHSFPPFDNYTEIENSVGVEVVYNSQDFTILMLSYLDP